MTSELEKQFFEMFEIEPHQIYPPQDELFGPRESMIEFFEEQYPEITDKILLKLICYLSRYNLTLIPGGSALKNVEALKDRILKCAMNLNAPGTKAVLYTEDIQRLFKETVYDC